MGQKRIGKHGKLKDREKKSEEQRSLHLSTAGAPRGGGAAELPAPLRALKETHEVELQSAIFSAALRFRVLQEMPAPLAQTRQASERGPGKDGRAGEQREGGGEEGKEPRAASRRSPTVGAPFLLQLLHLLQAEPGAFVDPEIRQNFLHSLCVRVLHGRGGERQMEPRFFFLLSRGVPPPQPLALSPTAPVLSP